jgi:hypothetical protein
VRSVRRDQLGQRAERGGVGRAAGLLELALGGPDDVGGADAPRLRRGGEVRGGQADVVDCAAVELEAVGERVELEVVLAPRRGRTNAASMLPCRFVVRTAMPS